jgi:hypothetical protein
VSDPDRHQQKATAQSGKVLQLLAELGITLHAHVAVDIPERLMQQAMKRRRWP